MFVHQKELDRVARLDETAPRPRRGVADRIIGLVGGLLGKMPSSVRTPLWHSGRYLLRILSPGRESGGVRIDSLVDEGLLPADSRAIEIQRELHDVERIVGEFYRVR